MASAPTFSRPRRRGRYALGAALAALAAAAAFSSPAGAVPVRGLSVTVDQRVDFRATIVSPAKARNCTANVQAAVVAYNPTRRLKALGNHRINVCQSGRRGVTTGRLRGYFGMGNIRAGRYAVCVRAAQALRTGRTSVHTKCRLFYWYGD